MKIGFDAKRLFNNFTGLGNYSRALVYGLNEFYPENDLFLFTPRIIPNEEVKSFLDSSRYKVVSPRRNSSFWRSFGCVKDINNLKLDIYHGLSHELPFGILKTKAKSVVTVHDLIYITYPFDFSLFDRQIYKLKSLYACQKADKIIAVSNSTKNDIINYFNISDSKVEVVYQSCHHSFKEMLNEEERREVLRKNDLPHNYMLYVGSVIERKNLLNLVKAIKLLKKENIPPLVVIGKGKKYLYKVKEYVKEHGLEKMVIFTSGISFVDLPAIYQNAKIFIYPSRYEGFGIPIIEALWSKTPVITSDISSLPEAAGPGAFYCNPESAESISEGIQKILSDKAYSDELVVKGFEHVQQFEDKNNADKLMEVYKSI
jgi:glycosyltransferase involved in cell wall biosynthesis